MRLFVRHAIPNIFRILKRVNVSRLPALLLLDGCQFCE
jgi:hypothetical protein